jgi:hypothetical protein
VVDAISLLNQRLPSRDTASTPCAHSVTGGLVNSALPYMKSVHANFWGQTPGAYVLGPSVFVCLIFHLLIIMSFQ